MTNCNICNKEKEVDYITLVCKECGEELEERWNITDRYFKDEVNGMIEYAELENAYLPHITKVIKNELFSNEYGNQHMWVEVKENA